jgi:hypothetical protein
VLAVPLARGAEETGVERRVVGHQHRAGQELEHARQHGGQPRCPGDHRAGDPGERHDVRRDADPRVHERADLADPLAAAHLHRADLGDGVALGAAAGGLEVQHDEGDLAQGSAELVERQLGLRREPCFRRELGSGCRHAGGR